MRKLGGLCEAIMSERYMEKKCLMNWALYPNCDKPAIVYGRGAVEARCKGSTQKISTECLVECQ